MREKKPDINRTRRMLSNTLRHCHNLYNKVGSKEQTWLAEINQAAKEALELLKEREQEEIGWDGLRTADIKGKRGTWRWKIHGKPESGGTLGEAICDQCGESTFATAVKGNLNFCPNCGAEMENGDK